MVVEDAAQLYRPPAQGSMDFDRFTEGITTGIGHTLKRCCLGSESFQNVTDKFLDGSGIVVKGLGSHSVLIL